MALQPDHLRFSEYFRAALEGHDQLRSQGEYLVTLILTAHSRIAVDEVDLFPDRVALSRLALSIMGIQADEPDWVSDVCSKSSVDLTWAGDVFRAQILENDHSEALLTLPQSATQREALRYALTIIQPVRIEA